MDGQQSRAIAESHARLQHFVGGRRNRLGIGAK